MWKFEKIGKFFNKKVLVGLFFVLIFLIGGFFWWQRDRIKDFLEKEETEKMVALSEDYITVEDSNEKFIVNKKDGFKIKIPESWKTEIGIDMAGLTSERNVILYSQDFNYRLQKGCLIEMQINRLKEMRVEKYGEDIEMFPYEGVKEVRGIIDSYKSNEAKEGGEIILIDETEALKETKILKDGIGKYVSIKIPTENKVYIFNSVLFSDECEEEFKQSLETVLIQ